MNEILVDVTALPEVMAWRENSGFAWVGEEVKGRAAQLAALSQPGTKVLRDARPLKAGVPGIGDIMGVARKRGFALEVKTEDGSQEVSQRRFQRAFEAAGGAYKVVRSSEEAVAFLRASIGR